VDPELRRLQPYMTALVTAYATGMLSLSLCYSVPTFTILALATVYGQAAMTYPPVPALRFNLRFFVSDGLRRRAVPGLHVRLRASVRELGIGSRVLGLHEHSSNHAA